MAKNSIAKKRKKRKRKCKRNQGHSIVGFLLLFFTSVNIFRSAKVA